MAGFWVGEQYHVPHTTVPVPSKLQQSVFPFAEDAKCNLTGSAATNQGVLNFFELLQFLRPFFWRVSALVSLTSYINCGFIDLTDSCCYSCGILNTRAAPSTFPTSQNPCRQSGCL